MCCLAYARSCHFFFFAVFKATAEANNLTAVASAKELYSREMEQVINQHSIDFKINSIIFLIEHVACILTGYFPSSPFNVLNCACMSLVHGADYL